MPGFNVPSVAEVTVARSVPTKVDASVIGVGATGSVPRSVGASRKALAAAGFEGKPGQVVTLPSKDGPLVIAVGTGEGELSPKQLRDAAAAAIRATKNLASHVAIDLADGATAPLVAQAVTEGALLAAYRYVGSKTDTSSATALTHLTHVVGSKSAKAATEGAEIGRVTAAAQALARELANTPPNQLNASDLADIAVDLGIERGLEVEVFNADQLAVMGCGGILGVNAGSVQPPRMVKLTYTPRRPKASVAMVGKGITYDSGGISLKPTNESHAQMKMDMSGAAAVLGTMTTLDALGCRNKVTAWLMCTDNMPSGSATKLGAVLTIRNGKTVEVQNTDAEGRLVLADGLSLATETEPDVIIDIATLTGAAMVALGTEMAAVLSNDDSAVEQAISSAARTDEPVWRLPLAIDDYRKLLDSQVADMRNVGGPYAGTVTASIFLSEFVDTIPWVHIDMAGTMSESSDKGWKSRGATAFGTRLLIDFVTGYTTSN